MYATPTCACTFFLSVVKSRTSFRVYEFNKLVNCLCINSGQMYFNFSCCQSNSQNLRWMSEGSLTSEMVVVVVVVCGQMWRVRMMKEPGSDQKRENEMAFDLVGRW